MTSHNFGFKKVTPEDKTSLVGKVFRSVASRYDVMNDLMSFGVHRLWKSQLVHKVSLRPGIRILDMSSGTGDIALRILEKAQKENVEISLTCADPCEEMLSQNKARLLDAGFFENINWVQSAAEDFLCKTPYDYYINSFGVRNITHRAKALQNAFNLLNDNGEFICLEFSPPQEHLFDVFYNFYSLRVIPKVGHFVAGDEVSYKYLVESIRRFPRPEEFQKEILEAGFKKCSFEKRTNGIVCIYRAWRS